MTTATRREFATLLGVAVSYVTHLDKSERLVFAPDGLVDVEASQARIAATADPNRADVAARHAKNRAAKAQPVEIAEPPDEAGADITYQAARTMKELYAAKTAKLEYERAAGLMIERAAVSAAVEDLLTSLRHSLEQQPYRLAPMLLGQDLDSLRGTLRQETEAILAALVKDFAMRLRQLAGEDDTE